MDFVVCVCYVCMLSFDKYRGFCGLIDELCFSSCMLRSSVVCGCVVFGNGQLCCMFTVCVS